MSSVLKFNEEVLPLKSLLVGSESGRLNHGALNEYAALAHASIKHGVYRDVTETEPASSKKSVLILSGFVVALHLAGFWAYLHSPSTPYVPPKKTEVLITLAKPPEPPPIVEPPPPPPPPPKAKQPPPPPKAAPPALRTPPADTNISPSDMVVKENTEAPKTSGPVEANVPAEPPAPPAPPPPKEEPLVEAFGGIGYLNNPAPEYPAAAERQGWEGKVQLRVKVLPDGTAGDIEVKKSSGHKLLDDTAIKAVKGWKFSPARRGTKNVEGSVNVSLDFQRS